MTDRLGLVLAGGAARGAYEAGVLRFVFVDLARRMGRIRWPDVVSGTSVGALNGSFVVARDRAGIDWVSRTWREMEIHQIYGMTFGGLFSSMRAAFADRAFALADPRPLQRLVARNFPRKAIRQSVDEHGVCWIVGTTDLATGRQVLFLDSRDPPAWKASAGARLVHTRIKALHVLASAALPLMFPPLAMDGALLVDGGLRMNTPLSPVLRSGADRVLVVSLKRVAQDHERSVQVPNLTFLIGKVLNALLLDPVEQDVQEAARINKLIAWGVSRYGEDFASQLRQDLGFGSAEIEFLAPSVDVGELAAEVYRTAKPKVHGPVSQLLERAAGRTGPDADLLSYIFFDRAFTGALEQLGYEDAARKEDALARLFAPADTNRYN